MSRFGNIPRPSFASRPGTDQQQPAGLLTRGLARRTTQLHEAGAVLSVLPQPGEALHAVITGRFDLMHLVVAVLEKIGPADAVRIATLSYNGKNLAEMVRLLDETRTKTLTLLCSAFFRDHNRELWEETLSDFRDRKQRAAAARSHAKVVTIHTPAGVKLVVEGSANLRSNGNREQVALIRDAALHDWHAAWIDQLVTAHEGENRPDGEGG